MDETSQPHALSVSPPSITVDQALTYLHHGWSVIPMRLGANAHGNISKRPGVKWQTYQQRLPSQQEIQHWFSAKRYNGIGVVTGKISGLVVVDIESGAPSDDVAGIESSLESSTISGGRHVFYRWTRPIGNAVRIGGKLIDIRGDGGLVVLPPSQLGTKGYVWLKKATPQSLVALPHHIEVMVAQAALPHAQANMPKSAGQFPSLQPEMYPAARAGERNATAAKVAGSLCANIAPKLWEIAGWPALFHWNQTQCIPPLDLQELQQVWSSITTTHQRHHPNPLLNDNRRERSLADSVPIMSWHKFSTLQFKEPEWLVANLIPQHGLVAVAGPPESCKSYFTTYLGITVARGQQLFGQFATKQTPVLLIDQENLPVWIQHRLTQFQAEAKLPLHIYADRGTPFNVENDAAFVQVSNYIESYQIGLVILDTLRLSHNRDENSSTDMKPVFERLKTLTQKTAVLFIQHHRKMDRSQRDKVHGEDMMGSMLIRGSVDYQLSIIKLSDVADSTTQIKVSQTKARYTRNLPSFTLTLEESATGLAFVYHDVAPQADLKLTSAKQAILALLATQPLTRQALMEQLMADTICSARTGDEALKRLRETGAVVRDDNKPHAYALADPTSTGLQTVKPPPLQAANTVHRMREKGGIHNDNSQPPQPQPEALQGCSGYIELRPATLAQPLRENGVFHQPVTSVVSEKAKAKQPTVMPSHLHTDSDDQVGEKRKFTMLTNQQLQLRIRKVKHWLLNHQRISPAQPPLAVNGQPYELARWRQHLEHYCLLIDTAQDRGTVHDDDWLEMGRMIFHADDGTTGKWQDQLIHQ